MQQFLGHLAATVVFVVVAGVLFTLQQRSRLQLADASVRYAATSQTVDLLRVLRHDLDNLIDPVLTGQPASCEGDDGGQTTALSFVSQHPLTLEEVAITYRLHATPDSALLGGRTLRLYELTRETTATDGRTERIRGSVPLAELAVAWLAAGGAVVPCTTPGTRTAPPDLAGLRVHFVTAAPNPITRVAADQTRPDALVLHTHTFTVRPPNLHR